MATPMIQTAHRTCGDCPIRNRGVCSRCNAEELEELSRIKYYMSFEAGQPIIWAGDRMGFVASVVTGLASLTQSMEDGRRQIVGLLLPSDFLGRPGRDRALYDVTAVTQTVLCCFRRVDFEKVMDRTPHLSHRLLEMTLDELDASREWMTLLGRKKARERIASLLSIMARRHAALGLSNGPGVRFDLPLSREEMADYLGLTFETVSRQMSALKREGVIGLKGNRSVIIEDFDRLLCETGDDADGGVLV